MTAQFLNLDAFAVHPHEDGVHFTLLTELRFLSAEQHRTVVAPAGFVTDFFSSPPGTHELVPKVGKGGPAAAIHDAGYQQALQNALGQRIPITKDQADRLFLEGLAVLGIPLWKRYAMYLMVKWFGHGTFNDKRAQAKARTWPV